MSTYSETPLTRFYARAFYVAVVLLLGALVARILQPFTSPLLWAALLAFMTIPLERRFTNRWKKPNLSAGLVTALVAIIVAGPVSIFTVTFIRQGSDLYTRFQAEATNRKLPALDLVLEFPPAQRALALAEEVTAMTRDELAEKVADAAGAGLKLVGTAGTSLVVGAFSIISQFFLTLFLLFFFVRDGRRLASLAVRLVPMPSQQKGDLIQQMGSVTQAVVLGTLATAAVQGTLLGLGFGISGLPSPLVFGAVGALASLIPVVGTSLVWIPGALTLAAQGRTGWAIFLTVWCIVLVAGSDNVIRPLIISGRSNASTLLVFIGVLGGASAFGFSGLFVGPILLSLVGALLRYADESRMARQSESQISLPPVG
jgi:predicted PurR-regulated permease PerM